MNIDQFLFTFNRHSQFDYSVLMKNKGLERYFTVRLYFDTGYTFLHRHREYPDIAFDLLDLAIAVYTADWHSKKLHDIPVNIHINLPVRYPEVWNSPLVKDALHHLLYFYTEDQWQINFTQATYQVDRVETDKLPLLGHKEVALWSAGIDSFSGLVQRIDSNSSDEYLLFGTGSNDFIYGRQKYLIRGNRKHKIDGLREIYGGKIGYQRLLIQFRGNKNISNNPEFRVRGLSFILLGAVTAYLEGQNSIHIYENGVGAINLPLSAAEVGLDHARSVHPISLFYIEQFLNYVLGDFRVLNPFWDKTKGEMCLHLATDPRLISLAFQTVTCDRLPRISGRQCGYCTSCLLRREAFLASNIEDRTTYGSDSNYFVQDWDIDLRAVSNQVNNLHLAIEANNQDKLFHEFPLLNQSAVYISKHLSMSENDIKNRLYRLYKQYVSEWKRIEHTLTSKLMSDATRAIQDRH